MDGKRGAHGTCYKWVQKLEDLRGRNHLEELSENGRIILKWVLGKLG
jgi:hypothetical protein